ncbi:hypothetical protein [Mucisphaera calidilacus]|uniref:Uncharacterized protein n=1 Tax=Mucisphaera calidilacus TaxID=2527982 RepID=A0A518C057_9BACT|nr:hypothetical protein [Mucisphaera calidilacus]QDU72608.1 hypothetical protein Pan265_24790 [Mucisphaera calidilacus]
MQDKAHDKMQDSQPGSTQAAQHNSPNDPNLVAGVVEEVTDDTLTLRIPGTDYRLSLVIRGETPEVGKTVTGTIHANAKRVDVIAAGGRYIEPVYGRPRRIQGRIIAGDPAANTITVKAAVPVVCAFTDQRQQTARFSAGQMVSFDVQPGATFTPEQQTAENA